MGGTRSPHVGGPHAHALRPDAIPQPYGRGDSRFPAAGPPRRQARQAPGSVFPARRDERAFGARRCGDCTAHGGSGPRRDDDGVGVGRRLVRRVSGAALHRGGSPRARSVARARRVLRRGELQHRHRVRVHRSQRDERDELCVGDHCGRRGIPRRARRARGHHARRWRRGAARTAHIRGVQHHPRHEHPQ